MRLIDADALIEKAEFIGDAFTGRGGYAVWGDDVLDSPTVDPVEHGVWVSDDGNIFRCSKCGHKADDVLDGRQIAVNLSRYCPYCGRRMGLCDGDEID